MQVIQALVNLVNEPEPEHPLRAALAGNHQVSVPDPYDPYVFGPPGSGSVSHKYGCGSSSGSFPFFIKVLSAKN
jgi:hypothetical protein